MILNIILIIARVICGLMATAFILGACLYKKHRIFENIFEWAGFITLIYGLGSMIRFVIVGN
jgi:hypothetical protein